MSSTEADFAKRMGLEMKIENYNSIQEIYDDINLATPLKMAMIDFWVKREDKRLQEENFKSMQRLRISDPAFPPEKHEQVSSILRRFITAFDVLEKDICSPIKAIESNAKAGAKRATLTQVLHWVAPKLIPKQKDGETQAKETTITITKNEWALVKGFYPHSVVMADLFFELLCAIGFNDTNPLMTSDIQMESHQPSSKRLREAYAKHESKETKLSRKPATKPKKVEDFETTGNFGKVVNHWCGDASGCKNYHCICFRAGRSCEALCSPCGGKCGNTKRYLFPDPPTTAPGSGSSGH